MALQSWVERRSKNPTDFRKCVFDSALLKTAEREFVWYFNVHHLVADGWSIGLAYRRVSELYERSLTGQLGEEPGSYPSFQSFIQEERAYRKSSEFVEASAY